MKDEVILKVNKIDKRFGSTVALDQVDITVRRGKILGLIGENGSGKSTVTSIAAGMQKADSGTMEFKGQPWNPSSMIEALNNGIGMIVQESGTVPGITVAENIFLGEADQFKKGIMVDRKKVVQEAQKALDDIGANDINAAAITQSLDLESRKLVEIARIMHKQPELLVVDETTTALSQRGREIIYDIIKKMKAANKAVVFISHDLDEIIAVCDELTVLRDGKIIVTYQKEEFDENQIKTSMIGRELKGDYYRSDYDGSYGDDVVVEIKDGQLADQLIDFNLQLHKGEILGIGGLSHCGMHTLGKVMFGAAKLESGTLTVNGKCIRNEAEAMKQEMGYVSKDRDYESLCLNAPIQDNIAAGGLDKISIGNFVILPKTEKEYVEKQIDDLSIKCQGRRQYVSALSGGNKQKVVFGKWIGRGSEILVLDCPTRGVDIGVKQAMYQLIYKMKKEGKAIVIISEEMAELLGMSDRIIVMKDGRSVGEFYRGNHPQESDLIQYMI